MWRTNGARGYNRPLRVIPDSGQVSENVSHSPDKQRCDVFHEDKSGSKLANEARKFTPQAGSLSRKPCASASETDVLAWESAGNDIGAGDPIGSQSVCRELADIGVAGDAGPVTGEDAPGVLVTLAERDGRESCALKSEGEPSDAAEQVEDIHGAPV